MQIFRAEHLTLERAILRTAGEANTMRHFVTGTSTKHPTEDAAKISRRFDVRTRSDHPLVAAAAGHSPHALTTEKPAGTFDHGRES